MLNIVDTTKDFNPGSTKPETENTRRLRVWLEDHIAAGKRKYLAEVVTVTSALAGLLLERNPVNRPISKRNADELKQDIADSRFMFNGESIVVSDTGILLDGQHRCMAVMETGVPIQTVIVFGAKEPARFTIDTGKSKTVSNFLSMKGRSYTNILGPVVNYILQWKSSGRLYAGGNDTLRPSKQAILAAADELKGVDASIEFAALAMKTVRSHAVIAFCHWVFWKKTSREAADEFVQKLLEGDGLRKGDPILFCRNRLIGMGRGVDANTRAQLIFKCWNAWRVGSTVELFRASTGPLPKVEK